MTQFDRLSVRSTYTKVYTASSKLECEGEKVVYNETSNTTNLAPGN